jgi:hypothetical protein
MKKIVSPVFQIGSIVWGSWYISHQTKENVFANFVFVFLVLLFIGVILYRKDLL